MGQITQVLVFAHVVLIRAFKERCSRRSALLEGWRERERAIRRAEIRRGAERKVRPTSHAYVIPTTCAISDVYDAGARIVLLACRWPSRTEHLLIIMIFSYIQSEFKNIISF